MFCYKCGKQLDEDSVFCAYCGSKVDNGDFAIEVSAEQRADTYNFFTNIFTTKTFFALIILATVWVGINLFTEGLPIIPLLFMIAGWIAFNAAKNGRVLDYKSPINIMSGVMTATYVLNWVAVGFLCLAGVSFGFLGAFVPTADMSLKSDASFNDMVNEFSQEFGKDFAEMFSTKESLMVLFFVLAGVFIVLAVILTVFNVFAYNTLRKCAKSAKNSYISGILNVENIANAKVWLLVLGIFEGASALFTQYVIGGFVGAATMILAYVWLREVEKIYNTPKITVDKS